MANEFTIDVPGVVNRGLQFRQQEQLRPLQQQQAQFGLQQQQQNLKAGKQQIETAEQKAKSQSLFNTVARLRLLPDDQKSSFLQQNIVDIESRGGDATESRQAIGLIQQGRFKELNEGLESLHQVGVQTGFLKPIKSQTLEVETLKQRQIEQQFREEQARIKQTQLSPTVQKILDTAQTEAIDAGQRSRSLSVLADDVSSLDIGGGLASSASETFKNILGTQDDVSDLRRRFNAVRASQSVQNLPPGPASDKDIALALSGFPKENASGQQIVSFLKGAAKLEGINSAFQEFKSDLISNNKNTKGLLRKWKSKVFSEALNRDISISELFITAQEEGVTVDELKAQLGVK